MDRKFVVTGLTYALIGMMLGIYMSATKNHGQLVTHAHIMLLGFVVSFMYGLCHRLWLDTRGSWVARLQFCLHQLGSAALFTGLFLLYGGFVEASLIEPLLGIASVTVLVSLALMCALFLVPRSAAPTAAAAAPAAA